MPTLVQKIDANAAVRLPLPPNSKPSQELPRYKNFLKVETHRLKILHRAGGEGLEICRGRAALLDVLLRYILEGVEQTLVTSGKKKPVFALIAIGGYGRAELNPHSDIDIMFLHGGGLVQAGKPDPEFSEIIDGLLYTLWDIGLKVGHSVRSMDDCVKVANQDMQSKTSLIEARLIAGEKKLFEKMQSVVLSRCVSGHETEYIEARLADQESRRNKFGNSACMQEPNIKNGCGGLRDYQNLIWMTFFKYQTRSLAELQEKDLISKSEHKQLDVAYDFLLRVRNELHYEANRAADVLTRSLQPAVATGLGYHNRSPSGRLEEFMRDFYLHARNMDLITRMVEQRLALVPQRKLLPSFRQMFRNQRLRIQPQAVDGFKYLDGEIIPANSQVFKEKPWRLMRLFLYAQQRGLKLHPDLVPLIRQYLSVVDRDFLHDPHVRETFLEILNQRGNVAPTLRQMHEVGLLGKFIPEFGKLTCLVQHEFYHQYTADEHTLVCIEKLDQVWDAKEAPFNRYTELLAQLEHPYILYLALLLHDSGKAYRTGKHEEKGSQLSARAAKRLGLDGMATHTLSLLIESHLVMAQVSQRRDLEDPEVIRAFSAQIQNPENLAMLTLHTFADSQGTSSQLWNSFKDTLLWTLYQRTLQTLQGGGNQTRWEETQRELLYNEVLEKRPKEISEAEVEGHFATLPTRYFQIRNAAEVIGDLALIHRFIKLQLEPGGPEDNALAPVVAWRNEPDRGYTRVDVCTWDRMGLFSKITGSLTAARLNILGAEIITRTDGIILDTLLVTDARTGSLAKNQEKATFESVLSDTLTEKAVDLDPLIEKQAGLPTPYQSAAGEKIPTVIRFDNETSASRTVIDIEAEDRIGLLYKVSQTLSALDLDVALAKISTEKGAAIDTFYVTDKEGGKKIANVERQREIEKRLQTAIAELSAG